MSRQRPWEAPLSGLDKGVPGGSAVALADSGSQGWNLLAEDLPLPAAVIKRDALANNSGWMRDFLAGSGAAIAPHGKTTMSPALFDLQLADGAWAITVATPHQLQVARAFGYGRVFFANQLVGRSAIDYALGQLRDDRDFEFFCLVDSQRNAEALARAVRQAGLSRPLNVLVEYGYPGGRAGCRSVGEAMELARSIKGSGALALCGVEGFEGLFGGGNAQVLAQVEGFLDGMVEIARGCAAEDLFAPGTVLLTAGGSAFYDVVVAKLGAAGLGRESQVLVRSGCYITHDSILYLRAFDAMRERGGAPAGGGLQPALEVWAYVQSRPEAEKAIVGFGKRDASYDDLPVAQSWFRPNGTMARPQPVPGGHQVLRLNDQHCHLAIPADSPLQVGDMLGFGISHPCLTFDKWRAIHLVDEDYGVVSSLRTYF